jgi:phenylalanyl-tRNA synthetase beta chain
MEISYKWLRSFIDLPETPEQTGQWLTGTGLEVEQIQTIETVPGGLRGLVIGEVLTCQKHPDADKLNITTVDIGAEQPVQIVCGAANVAAGQRVVVATVGATLYPVNETGQPKEPFQIKKAKIRGVVSEGMICAEDEIGLGTSHDGIMVLTTNAPNGTPAAQQFNLDADYRISIGLTPNRADAASHLGTARDLSALLGRPVVLPAVADFVVADTSLSLAVTVEDAEACPRYTGLTVSGLTVGESPDWLKARLRSIGLNPINNVVDVTNFICHDLGQPLHAFDADKIAGNAVVVKTLPAGTPFVTLDGVTRSLTATDLMICDAEKPMCIGGVFGGQTSGVTTATTRIFLESAYFSPASIRKTAQHHRLKTDASFRFERGTDPNMPVFALKRAALLLADIAGGHVTSDIVDICPAPIPDFRVPVSYRNIDRLIGIQIDRAEIHRILTALDIRLADATDAGFVAIVPPYRVDVTREADVIEEILRIFGLDNVPLSPRLGAESLSEFAKIDPNQLRDRVAMTLAANGFHETVTVSLTRPAYHDALRDALPGQDVRLLNPLSEDLSVMRQTMLFSALEAVAWNLNRRQRDLKLFDFGTVYCCVAGADEANKYVETPRLTLTLTGNQTAESWQQPARPVGFHDLAGAVQQLLTLLRIEGAGSRPTESALLDYGLDYTLGKKTLGSLGLVKPGLARLAEVKAPVFYADLDWNVLLAAHNPTVRYREVPRFPEVRRDLSVVLDAAVSFADLERTARQTERKLLRAINVFDVYAGDKLDAGKKSYSVSFALQDAEQTLTDAVIDKTMSRLMAGFERDLGALIRK